jgi:DNA-binding MarR family transcriptional regulator
MSGTIDHSSTPERKSVELTDRDVRDAARLLTVIAAAGVTTPCHERHSREELIGRARQQIVHRKRRAQQFPKGIFGEPAWDMLLVLYVSDNFGPETIRDLRDQAELTHSTALRWLDYLESQQLIVKKSHLTDKRSAYYQLTDRAREKLDQYFSAYFEGPPILR